jgi:CDP-glucose 4,6-dehydratase
MDVNNFEEFKNYIQGIKPDYIFHFAAQSLVNKGYEFPGETFETNFLSAIKICLLAEELPYIQRVIIATTDKCYQNNESGIPFKESDALGGKDPYSASKAALELALLGLRQSKVITKTVSVRAGNVIGGGDWNHDRLVPDLISNLITKTPTTIRYPDSTRPWQYVLDVLWGYVLCLDNNLTAENWSFNFGPAVSAPQITVLQIASIFADALNLEVKVDATNIKLEAKILSLDSSLARRTLKWEPTYNGEGIFHQTMNWYEKVLLQEVDPGKESSRVISQYLQKRLDR